jgi:O-antigen/teichoic acid export membrane protein
MRRKILIDGISIALVRAVGMGLGLLVTVVIGRTLGPAGLGIYGYTVILLSLLAVPVSNGWATVVLRAVSRVVQEQEWSTVNGLTRRGAQLSLLVSMLALAVALLLYAYVPAISKALPGSAVLVILALVLCFDQLSALRLAVLRGLQHPVLGQAPEMLLRPALIVVVFLAFSVVVGPSINVQHAFWALVCASGLAMLAGSVILKHKVPTAMASRSPHYDTRLWLVSAAFLAGNSGLALLNSQVDMLMLGLLGSFEQVGAYRIAAQLALLSGFVYTALNMLAMQRFALLRATGDMPQLRETATQMARLAFLGTLPLPVICYLFGEQLIAAVFGEEFLPAIIPLFWLLGAQSISASAGMASTLLITHGHEKLIIRFTVVSLVLNIIFCSLLIPTFGMVGAGISTFIALGGWNIALWYAAKEKLRVDSSMF